MRSHRVVLALALLLTASSAWASDFYGGGTVGGTVGSGTANTIAKWTAETTLGDSLLSETDAKLEAETTLELRALSVSGLPTPDSPTVTPQGTPGASSYAYSVVALFGDKAATNGSEEGSTEEGNATLDEVNFNRVTWSAVAGATGYAVYRASGGETQGLIATVDAGVTTLDDTGLEGDDAAPPDSNTTSAVAAGLSGDKHLYLLASGDGWVVIGPYSMPPEVAGLLEVSHPALPEFRPGYKSNLTVEDGASWGSGGLVVLATPETALNAGTLSGWSSYLMHMGSGMLDQAHAVVGSVGNIEGVVLHAAAGVFTISNQDGTILNAVGVWAGVEDSASGIAYASGIYIDDMSAVAAAGANIASRGADSLNVFEGSLVGVTVATVATPGAPTVSPQGTTQSTTYGYKIVAWVGDRFTPASAEGTTTTGNAVLDDINFNRITWAPVPGAMRYTVRRTTGGATQGEIGEWDPADSSSSFEGFADTGLEGDTSADPTANTTGLIISAGMPSSDPGICGALYTTAGAVMRSSTGC